MTGDYFVAAITSGALPMRGGSYTLSVEDVVDPIPGLRRNLAQPCGGGTETVTGKIDAVTQHDDRFAISVTAGQTYVLISSLINARVYGGAGTLRPSGNVLIGQASDDFYILYSGLETIGEAVGGCNDYALTYASWTLNAGAEVETLSTSDHFASTAIELSGNEFVNTPAIRAPTRCAAAARTS